MNPLTFTIEKEFPNGARVGNIQTPHGSFETPAFCTVGTKGTVKAVSVEQLQTLAKTQVVLANTYHLFLQPGEGIVSNAGGLHQFMNWHGPLITDSGGFQVFSLGAGFGKDISKFTTSRPSKNILTSDVKTAPAVFDESVLTQHSKLAIVDEEGVSFTSHIDGTLYRFTPERSVEIQHALGADIFFAFDECTSPEDSNSYQEKAGNRTHRWAERSLNTHQNNVAARKNQALFGVVQGGRDPKLRAWSAGIIGAMDFDGFGIGGSFSKKDLGEALTAGIDPLPKDKPRHLLGIGEPEDILLGVSHGIDMFDCVQPTRMARTGTLYTKRGKINLLRREYIRDFTPLDKETGGYSSDKYTKAYLAHLFRAKEMLAATIASIHNLYFIESLMSDIRESIRDNRFNDFRTDFLQKYQQ